MQTRNIVFAAPCYIAMERYCRRMTSVTLMIPDHIRWTRWNFITRLISPMSSLAVAKFQRSSAKGTFF